MLRLLCLISALAAGAAFAEARMERDVECAGGVFLSKSAPSASACAQACSADALCMSWSYRADLDGRCELKAVVAPARIRVGAVSGLSARAPAIAHLAVVGPEVAEVAPPAPQRERDT
jgi:hypothetical protein